MREVVYIGRAGCGACRHLREAVIEPLAESYPGNVSIHDSGWDRTMERVNSAQPITRVPLIVVEHDGREEFRFSGALTYDQLEGIVTCDAETLSVREVLDGVC